MEGTFNMQKQVKANTNVQANSTQPKVSRLSQVRGRVTQANTTEYCLVDAKTLLLAVARIQAVGGAIMFSGTRDGSALVVSVLQGNDNEKFYCKDASEMERTLNDIGAAFQPDILSEVWQHIDEEVGKQ